MQEEPLHRQRGQALLQAEQQLRCRGDHHGTSSQGHHDQGSSCQGGQEGCDPCGKELQGRDLHQQGGRGEVHQEQPQLQAERHRQGQPSQHLEQGHRVLPDGGDQDLHGRRLLVE